LHFVARFASSLQQIVVCETPEKYNVLVTEISLLLKLISELQITALKLLGKPCEEELNQHWPLGHKRHFLTHALDDLSLVGPEQEP
jgi:hypothetical protein